jgi:spore germination cell wall hydrolase CwlJ-like protein
MVWRTRPKGVLSAPFGLSIFVFALAPNSIGRQDVAALIARQPTVTAHWRQHVRASAFGTIHKATFSFSRPIGTAMPRPLTYQLANLDPRIFTTAPWNAPEMPDDPPLQFPTVDRTAKGDRLPVRKPEKREPEPQTAAQEKPPTAPAASEPQVEKIETATPSLETATEPAPVATADADTDTSPAELTPDIQPAEIAPAEPAIPAAPTQEAAVVEAPIAEPPVEIDAAPEEPSAELAVADAPETDPAAADLPTVDADIPDPVDVVMAEATDFVSRRPTEPVIEMARLYFGDQPLGDAPGEIEKWAPGEEPIIMAPKVASEPADRDIKQSAIDPKHAPAEEKGESIAPKGEVTGEGKRPLTPAERLKLVGKDRAKAEKCLADAVYFESRGEPVRGQIAVAQVVMNRVFSGYYPRSVCGAVYQNKHRRLACQFTFACDGIRDTVTDPQAWLRATRIARDVLDGKYWVPEVNRATHYHAYWVRPRWVREMKRLYKFGVHTFYRPRKWGDGSDMPSWGSAEATKEAIAKL